MTEDKNLSTEKSYIVRKAKKNNYSVISNFPVRDKQLSWKAKGILWYLLQLPDDWKIYRSHIENQATDGRDSLSSGMLELQKNGYLVREKIREKGKIVEHVWIVYEEPISLNNIDNKEPQTENPVMVHKPCEPQTGKPSSGKPAATKDLVLPITKKTTNHHRTNNEGLVGGSPKKEIKIFACLENVSIKQKDKERLSTQFSESMVKRSVEYCTSPNFKPQKSLDASIFYFCKNPDYMTPNKEEILRQKQAEYDKQLEVQRKRKEIAEKIAFQINKKVPPDTSNPNWFWVTQSKDQYLEIFNGREECKIYYSDNTFKEKTLHYLTKFNYPIPKAFHDLIN